ncbi:hypothetical protein DSAG12_00510 [Promethearchaeum syntrophicum]|uniref:Uncharacterized protein n=1 Tax=Promethearchaeum syntrophicum TaxID=2594042 RepID=A0A5B9D7Y4_9ARCH|nr:hypothetical protein [Candidatus Prometheoarchaeum syntrophicum]QEE14696.1 hypothetical protein DSAG12_00510 [Candidatus Prometheoarchaeum syntrophicum]
MDTTEIFTIRNFEPVKIRGELYGNLIEFNKIKRHVKFTSKFHQPDFIHNDQIEKMIIKFDNKRKLLWLGIATIILFIGIFVLLAWIRLPPWKISIKLKKEQKPIVIRAQIDESKASNLASFCADQFQTILINQK